MAQTFTRILLHVVFSTKNRIPMIDPEIESELYAYIGGVCRNHASPLLAAGGTDNHIHLLISQSKNVALSHLVMDVKKDSSKWLKTKIPRLSAFHWQDGYGGFSIGESGVEALTAYITRQKEHHKLRTFEEEFLDLLARYGIEYDPKLIWD
jgi:putative transposase